MGFFLRITLILFAGFTLTACVTTPKGPLSLRDQLEHGSTITLPIIDSVSELLVVRAGLPDGSSGKFVIDTGATLSSIYPDVQKRLGLLPDQKTAIRVHGMIAAQLQPLTKLSGLTLGGKELPTMPVAVIPRAKEDTSTAQKFRAPEHDGIIGMDVLRRYHLYIDKPGKLVQFIPRELGRPSAPINWHAAELTRNPFLEDGRELHFFQLRLGNGLTPALIDTGSQFNMMNWNTKRFPTLRAVRKRLRKDWEIEGAIGSFKPVTKILSKNARAGQKYWGDNEFLVLDFESLNVLGIDGKPFVIAGMPMFSEAAVLIDFENDRMYFKPDGRRKNLVVVN